MRPSALVSFVALTVASVSHADIFQYEDCDGDGSLLLTPLEPLPFVDLSGLYLGCANLFEANLFEADLSGAILVEADLTGADLYGADLSGADLSGVRSGGIVGTPSFLPTEWILRSGYLIGPGANLSGAELSGLNLSGANLSDAILVDADLTGADLTYADLEFALLFEANLSGADLSGANLVDADLTGADLSGAILVEADLTGADLTGADLTGANLSGADLSGAFLESAFLEGANLTGADLTGADLTGAIGNVITIVDISDLAVDQTGSCCTNSGCASISESNCSAMGGTWTEGGSCDDCQPAADDCSADVDGDGTIGFSDVLVILNDWGACP